MAERGIIEQAYGQLIPQGMRPNYAAPRTSVEPTSMVGRGEIRPYNFSWRDMARQWLGSIGMSDNTANAVITLADLAPVFAANDTARAVIRGERLVPAADVALAAAPLPMAAKRAASKVVREVAQEVPTVTMRAFHSGPAGITEFRPSQSGAVGPGVYVASDERDAAYFGRKLGDAATTYALDVPKGPYASRTQFFNEVKRLGGATAETRDQVHAQASANLAANGFVGVRNGNESVIFDPKQIRQVAAQ
jgi:hypothetical protein